MTYEGQFLARLICLAAGGDPAKCDFDHCPCGSEGEELAKQLAADNYVICRMPSGVHEGSCPTCGCEAVAHKTTV